MIRELRASLCLIWHTGETQCCTGSSTADWKTLPTSQCHNWKLLLLWRLAQTYPCKVCQHEHMHNIIKNFPKILQIPIIIKKMCYIQYCLSVSHQLCPQSPGRDRFTDPFLLQIAISTGMPNSKSFFVHGTRATVFSSGPAAEKKPVKLGPFSLLPMSFIQYVIPIIISSNGQWVHYS